MTKDIQNPSEKVLFEPVRYVVVGYENQSDGLGGTISVPKYKRIEAPGSLLGQLGTNPLDSVTYINTTPPSTKQARRNVFSSLIAIVRSFWGRK